jgi:hypothetical protein
MKGSALRTLVLALVVVFGVPQEGEACVCDMPNPPCAAVWAADAIFAGTVRQIDDVATPGPHGGVSESKIVTFEVERGFVNAAPGRLQVVTSAWGASCGYRFTLGQQYLVYAYASDGNTALVASRCSRTRPIEQAEEDLRYLQHLPDPARGARVYGRVSFLHREAFSTEAIDYGPLSGLAVLVRGVGFVREAITDADGRYEIGGLPIGEVSVSVDAPRGTNPRTAARDLRLDDRRGCGQANFELFYSATATGRVVDRSGQPVARVQIEAVDFELAGHGPAPQWSAWVDASGRFTFDDLPPGRYVFGIGLTRVPHVPPKPRSREVYLPGVLLVSDARVVDVKAGDEIELGVLRLPD